MTEWTTVCQSPLPLSLSSQQRKPLVKYSGTASCPSFRPSRFSGEEFPRCGYERRRSQCRFKDDEELRVD